MCTSYNRAYLASLRPNLSLTAGLQIRLESYTPWTVVTKMEGKYRAYQDTLIENVIDLDSLIDLLYLYSSLQTKLIDEQFFEFIVDIFSL